MTSKQDVATNNSASLPSDSLPNGLPSDTRAVIKVIGVGAAGVNAVNRMYDYGLSGVELIAMNTDAQQFLLTDADIKIPIGHELTGGLGAGGNPTVGRESAEESADEIKENIAGADMVIITTGEGGGTGTGASPVVARLAKEEGCLTIGVATKPFAFEGRKKMKKALDGLSELRKYVDCLVTVPNERLRHLGDKNLTLSNAYSIADDVLLNIISAITEIITRPGVVPADFSDIKAIMTDAGTAIIGIGQAKGEDRLVKATEQAISSPLLENTIDGAKGVIFCTIGAEETLTLDEVAQAATLIEEAVDEDADIKDVQRYDDTLGDEVRVIVIATGFEDKSETGILPSNEIRQGISNQTGSADSDNTTITPVVSDDVRPIDVEDNSTEDFTPDFASNSSFSTGSNPVVGSTGVFTETGSVKVNDSRSVFSSDQNAVVNPTSGSIASISAADIPTVSREGFSADFANEEQEDSLELPDFLND